MLEHTKSKHYVIKSFQYIHNPVTKMLFGFNVNRDTIKNIKNARLKSNYQNIALMDVFKKIEVVNKMNVKTNLNIFKNFEFYNLGYDIYILI